MADTRHVEGMAEINRALSELPAKIEKNIIRAMVRAGAQVVRKAAIANIPDGRRDDVVLKPSRSKSRDQKAIIVSVGAPKNKPQLRWLETGTAAHEIKISRKKVLAGGGEFFGVVVDHPGQPARPWLRPALDENVDEVLEAMKKAAGKRIEKEAAKR